LNAPNETFLSQHAEGIVNRLPRDGTDLGADKRGNIIRRAMGAVRYCPQHGEALSRHLNAVFTKNFRRINKHDSKLHQILD
jgi:hypothetical protein